MKRATTHYRIVTVNLDDEGYWHFSVEGDGGSIGFALPKVKFGDVVPVVGDEIDLETIGFSQIVGLSLNGTQLFSMTEDEIEEDKEATTRQYTEDKKREFLESKDRLDADFETLPEVFKKRIARFRNANPNFRWEYEPYEMFCCKQALLIAETLKTQEEVTRFKGLSYEEQCELVPIDSSHSGNTFGMAVLLAWIYLTTPDAVWRFHGALCNLVGCEAYGDRKEDRELETVCCAQVSVTQWETRA
jgi:hypothetical protein